jgi:hypothetical protein
MKKVFLVCLLLLNGALAQQRSRAHIEGRIVYNKANEGLPGAKIVIVNLVTLEVQQARTDSNGHFRFDDLDWTDFELVAGQGHDGCPLISVATKVRSVPEGQRKPLRVKLKNGICE